MEIYGPIKLKGTLADGTGDPLLTKDSTTSEVGTTSNAFGNLQDGYILVGNASNEPTPVVVSGDIEITNAGVTSIASGVIVNSDVKSDAALAFSKMAALTASRALVSDASGVVSVSDVTATELSYLDGVTSAIQTQISGKQATITGAATTITSSNLTASRALVSNSSGKVSAASVTSTELGYLSGATSSIQTQLNTKLGPTISSVAEGDILYYNGTAWVNLARGTNGQALYSTATSIQWDTPTINGIPAGGTTNQVLAKTSGTDFAADWATLSVSSISDLTATAAELNVLDGITATVTELNYTDGVSGPIQSQIDGKLSSTLPQNAIFVGNSSNIATALTAGTSGYVLTSVAGVPTWQPVSAGSTPGSDTQVLFNDGGSFGADAGLVYNKTLDSLTIKNTRILDINGSSLFIGFNAGNTTTTGTSDVGIGSQALTSVTSGSSNVAIGSSALSDLTTGTGNIWIGQDNTNSVTTGNSNIVIGAHISAAVDSITTGSSNILIGRDILAQSPTADGQLSIANAIFGTGNTGTGTTASTGKIGVYVTAPTASLDIAASTTSKASLRIRSGTAPTTPNAGDLWFDGTNLKFYDGTTTKTFTLA